MEHFVPQLRRSLGSANSEPAVGPLAITEIHFEPAPIGAINNTADEFVEVRNTTLAPLPLFDPAHATNRWRLRGGVEFTFPAGATLPPGGFALIVGFDPSWPTNPEAAFRSAFGVPAEVPVFGPWSGTLNNAGEPIELMRPDEPVDAPPSLAGEVPYVSVDSVSYLPANPWPVGAAGSGQSLQRRRSIRFGDDPANWIVANPTPGRPSGTEDTLEVPADQDADGLPDEWEIRFGLDPASATDLNGPIGDPDGDGQSNRDEFIAGTNPKLASDRFVAKPKLTASVVEIGFVARPGRIYTVWVRDGLESTWRQVSQTSGVESERRVIVNDQGEAGARFYRITVAIE